MRSHNHWSARKSYVPFFTPAGIPKSIQGSPRNECILYELTLEREFITTVKFLLIKFKSCLSAFCSVAPIFPELSQCFLISWEIPWSQANRVSWSPLSIVYKKDLQDQDSHDGVITHLEPDILEFEVKWSLGTSKKKKKRRRRRNGKVGKDKLNEMKALNMRYKK